VPPSLPVLRRHRAVALLVGLALVAPLTLVPVEADAQSLQEIQRQLAEAEREREGIEQRLAEATAEFDRLETRIGELEAERDDLVDEVAELRRAVGAMDVVISTRVRETFKHGAALDPFAVFLGSDDPSAALTRAETVQRVVAADRVRTEDLLAARAVAAAAEDRLAERTAELEEALAAQAELGEQLQADFERIQELEARLTEEEREERARLERERLERERREREERERRAREAEARAAAQRAAAARTSSASTSTRSAPSAGSSPRAASSGGSSTGAASSGGWACPLDQPRSFIDSWGAPRSGGRGHRGTDIMGPHGIPVRAITSGTWVHQSYGASAGIWGILRGDNGDHYWYMHLSSHTVGSGARVSAGQQIGTNGATGNAPPNAPHVHFELHPGGGGAVNPYSLLRRVCG
jgi:peptidoglycan LD-endopeptidase LytH